jgi:hypothetical protein
MRENLRFGRGPFHSDGVSVVHARKMGKKVIVEEMPVGKF